MSSRNASKSKILNKSNKKY